MFSFATRRFFSFVPLLIALSCSHAKYRYDFQSLTFIFLNAKRSLSNTFSGGQSTKERRDEEKSHELSHGRMWAREKAHTERADMKPEIERGGLKFFRTVTGIKVNSFMCWASRFHSQNARANCTVFRWKNWRLNEAKEQTIFGFFFAYVCCGISEAVKLLLSELQKLLDGNAKSSNSM